MEEFYVGEALIGSGDEVAHVDLIIGSKKGPAGIAFANALSQLSAGHTPLLAVIRPNLAVKPSTIVIPKVTIRNLEDANKIFGPAQTAVARAVADAVAEGIIVHTVAIGDSVALNFMEELAKRGNGLFYKVSCDCPWDCIYEELASKVSNAVVLVNDVSGSMDWRASLDCPGTGIPVVHKNILQDLNISITGTIDCYNDEKFITHKGNLRVEVSPDIINKIILNVKNSKLEYSSLEYPVKHELYRKEIRHGIYEPGYPYTPINPTPSYGNLPAHNTYSCLLYTSPSPRD